MLPEKETAASEKFNSYILKVRTLYKKENSNQR